MITCVNSQSVEIRLISGDSKPLPITVSTFLKNPANGKIDVQSYDFKAENGLGGSKDIQNPVMCKLIINKHKNICIFIYWNNVGDHG